jgi:UDP-N-acetylmuramoyl-L-alanyl-D-glutamate--2,6-diaminopimelate ligase
MDTILSFVRRFIPRKAYSFAQPAYHFLMSLAGAIVYGFPSRKLTVIAVTGTKGKTTVTELIHNIFRTAGKKVALSNTIHFIINGKEQRNLYKMSMPGRFFMQRFLRQAVKAGCTHAVIEATSEGARFFRHRFMALDAVVFTNLSPEHIESHGSYEAYQEAKLDIARQLKRGCQNRTVLVVNADDKAAPLFLAEHASEKYRFFLGDAEPYQLGSRGIDFTWKGTKASTPLTGAFNLQNILAALTVCEAFGVSEQHMLQAVRDTKEVKGRVERVDAGQPFEVVVDYAHTSGSLEALYESFAGRYIIGVLGNTGGGRDTWKRPEMAKVAAKYCNRIILTNEDPYDDDPMTIVNQMAKAIPEADCQIIIDRRQAIATAIRMAQQEFKETGTPTAVLITGKGTDPYIMGPNGTKESWSDTVVAREELEKLYK